MGRAVRFVLFASLFCGAATIAYASLVYFADDEVAPFIVEKLPLPLENVWIFALKLHVVAAAFCLPACLILQWKGLLRLAPRVHRWLGRVTGTAIVFALGPSGLYLSLFAKGGFLGTVGFALSGVLTVACMVQAVRHARAGRYVAHRRAALHVLAQLSVAVTSRAMLVALEVFAVDLELAYLIALWVPVVGSALVVELVVTRQRGRHENIGLRSLRPVPVASGLRR